MTNSPSERDWCQFLCTHKLGHAACLMCLVSHGLVDEYSFREINQSINLVKSLEEIKLGNL